MTETATIWLSILMGTNIVFVAVIWKLRQEFNGYKQGAELVITQLSKQLHFLQTLMNNYHQLPCNGSTSIHYATRYN